MSLWVSIINLYVLKSTKRLRGDCFVLRTNIRFVPLCKPIPDGQHISRVFMHFLLYIFLGFFLFKIRLMYGSNNSLYFDNMVDILRSYFLLK